MKLLKTELCHNFEKNQQCNFTLCKFAHSFEELVERVRHITYKTKVCQSFSKHGSCPYGSRCQFIHGDPMLKKSLTPIGSHLTEKQVKPLLFSDLFDATTLFKSSI